MSSFGDPGTARPGQNARECSEVGPLDSESMTWKRIVYRPDGNLVVKMEPVFSINVRTLPILSVPLSYSWGFVFP